MLLGSALVLASRLALPRSARADDTAPAPSPQPASASSFAPADPPPQQVNVRGSTPLRSASEVVLRRDVLGIAPHRTGSDLLQVIPGVFITQHSGEGKAHQIFLRGFDASHGQDIEIWAG